MARLLARAERPDASAAALAVAAASSLAFFPTQEAEGPTPVKRSGTAADNLLNL